MAWQIFVRETVHTYRDDWWTDVDRETNKDSGCDFFSGQKEVRLSKQEITHKYSCEITRPAKLPFLEISVS